MKLKTSLPVRRDGLLPKIELGTSARGVKNEIYLADESGEYDVPDTAVAQLIASGNFSPADGSEYAPPAGEPDETGEPEAPKANVIAGDDGQVMNLDGMSRKELADFAAADFGLTVKANDNKGDIIAAIMATVKAPE